MVKDIHSGGSSSPFELNVIGNTLYFYANDDTNGYELWKSDGTANGTMMVKDINPLGDAISYTKMMVGSPLLTGSQCPPLGIHTEIRYIHNNTNNNTNSQAVELGN
jgi:ELWxxDGT repeat protein